MAAPVLFGFAVFGALAGTVARRVFRNRRFGLWKFMIAWVLGKVFLALGAAFSILIFTVGPDDVPSDIERATFQLGAWPLFWVVAIATYRRRTEARVLSRRTIGPFVERIDPDPPASVDHTPAAATLPKPF